MITRVLILDDGVWGAPAYPGLLEVLGMHVELTTRSEEALERIADRSFDVVVADVSALDADRIAFLQALRALEPDLPVILVTELPSIATAVIAAAEGAYRTLAKPFARRELVDGIADAARARRDGLVPCAP